MISSLTVKSLAITTSLHRGFIGKIAFSFPFPFWSFETKKNEESRPLSSSISKPYANGPLAAIPELGVDRHQGLNISENPALRKSSRGSFLFLCLSLSPSSVHLPFTDAREWLIVYVRTTAPICPMHLFEHRSGHSLD